MDGNLHLGEAMRLPARHGQRQQTRNPSTHPLVAELHQKFISNKCFMKVLSQAIYATVLLIKHWALAFI
jgi:hypothetical protein